MYFWANSHLAPSNVATGCFSAAIYISRYTKVGVLRDSHNIFSTPYRIFECFFGAKKNKTVLAGLRVKKQ
jgi:hypothetical protein